VRDPIDDVSLHLAWRADENNPALAAVLALTEQLLDGPVGG
jgi:hypothetical protein